MIRSADEVVVRNTRREDFPAIIDLSRRTYPHSPPWNETQLGSHLDVFPEGQFVAARADSGEPVGMAASLIVSWDDYDMRGSWRDFTSHGMFTNHDGVRGRTLYAAEIMVHPACQGRGVGRKMYEARRELARRLGLLRIRAGARLRGYGRYAERMSAEEYAVRVIRGEFRDPTLSFQLHQGFRVLAIVSGYLRHDQESRGYAAVIEWLNPRVARPEDRADPDPRFDPRCWSPGGAGGDPPRRHS
ncbi:MAG: GNAT family N-acetyltransferase [Acidobacteriota bacterium]